MILIILIKWSIILYIPKILIVRQGSMLTAGGYMSVHQYI